MMLRELIHNLVSQRGQFKPVGVELGGYIYRIAKVEDRKKYVVLRLELGPLDDHMNLEQT